MILNREVLTRHTAHKYTVVKVLSKAKNFNITFDRMSPNVRGSLYPTVHFLKADWIEAQKEHLKVMRSDAVAANTQLLEFVEGIR